MHTNTFPSATREIDVTGLEPPEPMMFILEALDEMPPQGALLVKLDREPHPLFRVLEQNNFRRSGGWQEDRTYQLLIWRDAA
ncbi:DUF2249 domain-containing protein [Duganella sp. FT92W]|uniref:DUF2249 domain-containing protein n=1 Tax=Pseudoduganella rivuli TaxID=2666085 RepID=A0A7X2IKT6_9BURK|nr:DUF2249 domain-containing protein [Pseudoduganella rivuli]MRV71809.1 DUF2249 domain-containing protein [Pseudoduganella rivuli]